VTTPDTSVLVAGADPQHPFFDVAAEALGRVRSQGVLVAHTIAETYAVLTGSAYGLAPARVEEYLAQFLRRRPIGISPAGYVAALHDLCAAGVFGPAVYDGLIALGARGADATLVSLDRRAAPTYRRCGVRFDLLTDQHPESG
jgi:predicted nucleic acid-binding protein